MEQNHLIAEMESAQKSNKLVKYQFSTGHNRITKALTAKVNEEITSLDQLLLNYTYKYICLEEYEGGALKSVGEYMNIGDGKMIEAHNNRYRVLLSDSIKQQTLEKVIDQYRRVDSYRLISFDRNKSVMGKYYQYVADHHSFVYRREDREVNNYQIVVVDEASVDGLGISGSVQIKGPKHLWNLTQTVIEGEEGFKIEGKVLHFLPFDVKITKEGTNFEAVYKAESFDELTKVLKNMQHYIDNNLGCKGVFKIENVFEIEGGFYSLTPAGYAKAVIYNPPEALKQLKNGLLWMKTLDMGDIKNVSKMIISGIFKTGVLKTLKTKELQFENGDISVYGETLQNSFYYHYDK